jgi:hypothetical protein
MDFIGEFVCPCRSSSSPSRWASPQATASASRGWCDDFSTVALNFYANISSEQLTRGSS